MSVSSTFVSSSSNEILLQSGFLMEKNFDRSNPVPLKPVILDDTIGITSIADALSESSPKPRESAKAACKENNTVLLTVTIRTCSPLSN